METTLEDAIGQAVAAVVDPELDLPLGDIGMVRGVSTRRHRVGVTLALPVAGWPDGEELRWQVAAAAAAVSGVRDVAVELVVMSDPERDALRQALRHRMSDGDGPSFLRPGSKTMVIGISSGKGGVGKSSVTV